VSPQLNHLIDTAMQRRESLLALLVGAQEHGRHSEALSIEYTLAELDGFLAVATRISTIH
jgi:hypothetical protein